MKKKRGRKSLLSEAGNEEWSDIRNRITYGSAEWQIIRLRQLILAFKKEEATARRSMLLNEQKACRGMLRKKLEPWQKLHWQRIAKACDEALRQNEGVLAALERGDESAWRLADNYLSARKAKWERIGAEKRYVALAEIDWLWNPLSAQFERAVLQGDAHWFERQAKAIEKGGLPPQVQFKTKVIDLLETETWSTWAKQRAKQEKNVERWKEAQKKQQIQWEQYLDSPEGRTAGQGERQAKRASLVQSQKAKPCIESATLTPAGKFIDATAGQIYDSLDKVECPKKNQPHGVKVEGAYFENRERCCTAIRKLAEKYLKARLRHEQGKRPRTKPAKPLSTDFYHGLSRKAHRDAIERLRQVVGAD